jgi:hypothetical protein
VECCGRSVWRVMGGACGAQWEVRVMYGATDFSAAVAGPNNVAGVIGLPVARSGL